MPTTTHFQSFDMKDIRSEIKSLISLLGGDDVTLIDFLTWSVGRVLMNASKRGENWRNQGDNGTFAHIRDWLKAALVNDEPWLANVDNHGRPKKLLKFASVEDITKEANKAMLKASQRLATVKLVEGDEELYADLGEGHYLVRLLTSAALDRESASMQHCIGNGAYDDKLEDGNYVYLSLRDGRGKPHATLEIENNIITQLQGKQNEPPAKQYIDRLIPYLKSRKFESSVPVSYLGYVVDINGVWYAPENLPEELTVRGDLDFFGTAIKFLPNVLTVGGDLNLSKTGISTLPLVLNVGGSLYADNTNITFLPPVFNVGKTLFIANTGIQFLPEGLTVPGSLVIHGTKIAKLPMNLSVGRHLFVDRTAIAFFPQGVKFGGSLSVGGTKIKSLPEGLTISEGEVLYIEGSGITRIPNSINDNIMVSCDRGSVSAKNFRKLYMSK